MESLLKFASPLLLLCFSSFFQLRHFTFFILLQRSAILNWDSPKQQPGVMTAKDYEEISENEPARGGNDDDASVSSSSSESSSSSDSDDSSVKSSPPESIDAEQIRQNARELLQSSPGSDSVSRKAKNAVISGGNPPAMDRATGYQSSYHDAPTVVHMSSTSQYSNDPNPYSQPTSSPPWTADSTSTSSDGMTMTDVASMAFNCVAHCLTEGYRAASNYYSDYPQDEYPSVGPTSGSSNNASHNYQQVGGYQNTSSESYNNSTGYNNRTSGGYQTKFSDNVGQVMDRGMSSSSQSSGQGSTEQSKMMVVEQKNEWATVHVPSTYQGGRVGGAN